MSETIDEGNDPGYLFNEGADCFRESSLLQFVKKKSHTS